jgi:hypothetical protein
MGDLVYSGVNAVCTPVNSVEASYVLSSQAKSIDDVVTPRYRQRIAAGEVINNPCYLVDTTEKCSVSSVNLTDSGCGNVSYSGCLSKFWLDYGTVNFPVPTNSLVSALSAQDVRTSALAGMDRTEYAFGEDLGEIGETIRFLKNPIASLTKLATRQHALKLSKIRKGKDAAVAAAESYAAYQWAYKPLVRSVNDLTEALLTQVAARKPRYSSRSRLVHSQKSKHAGSHTIGSMTGEWESTNELDIEVKAQILYENHRNDNETLKKYGLRLKDAPKTAWQLFPASFMLDRVVNVSNAISAVGNLLDANLVILAASTTTKTTRRREYTLTGLTSTYWTVHGFTPDKVVEEQFTYNREVWTPQLSDIIPPVTPGKLIEDVQSILDLTAITILKLK